MPTISHQFKSPNTDGLRTKPIQCIVLHATVSANVRSPIGWLCNPQSQVSTHYVIGKDGAIYQLVSDDVIAWHAGVAQWQNHTDVNAISLGVELENRNDGHDPYTPELMASLAWLCRQLLTAYGLTPDAITTHAMVALPIHRKSDPAGFDLGAFRSALAPTAPRYTPDSPLLGTPLTSAIRWSGAKSAYDRVACKIITESYWKIATAVGLDPVLPFAQMLHETGNLTSFWCQRPRRNPAGIGVTGVTSPTDPGPGAWAYNPASGRWHAGLSFKTWADDAIPAHLGRLLGYALKPEAMNAAQRDLYLEATAIRPLPQQVLGSAPTIKQLGQMHNPSGLGWASPGDNYGAAIASIANRLVEAT